ncbi:MAG: hypothetical protein Q9201_007202 [Fulgogasparrea decipioides]
MKNQNNSHQEYNSKLDQLCQKSLKPSDIYARFARGGLDFGPAFRNITAASAAEGYSTATVTVPDTAKMMPNKYESIYILHPGTFDACFQVTDFAASGGDLSRDDIHVPTFVKNIEMRHALFKTPGHNITVRASAARAHSAFDPDIRASFSAFDTKPEGELLFEVEGLIVSKLPSQETDIGPLGERGLCYKMVWEPCIDLLKPEQYTQVFSGSLSSPDSTDQIQILERAAFYYIQRALESITLAETDHFPHHLQKLYSVLCALLEQGNRGGLPFQNLGWVECSEAAKQAFLANLEASDDSGRLVCTMGQKLATIFRGDTEPLSIMLQDNMLGTYYRGHPLNKRGNEIAASTLSTLAHQAPHMKIIELGAGTGAASMPILRALGTRFAHYDFTDISTGFFEGAKEEQAEWVGKISYRKLDIEHDPIAQGFEPESYDLVIAFNVLHATSNITVTLQNVRRLLRPGGKALISEITAQLSSTAVIFGTLPGWWLGEEPERRDGPFLNERQWDLALRRTGFGGLNRHVRVNGDGPSLATVLLASAEPEQEVNIPDISLVASRSPPEDTIIQSLRKLVHDRFCEQPPVEKLFEVVWDDRYTVIVALEDTTWLDLDAVALGRMKRAFQSARGILWVVRGARSQIPIANMITGLARSIRSENAGLQLSTLDLDSGAFLSPTEVAGLIMQVAEFVFDSGRPKFVAEMEFSEMNGLLHIPRILGEKSKDDYVVRETRPPVPELQPFIQEGRPLKMKLGQIGLLDTVHFEGDRSLGLPLAKNEVEISVKAAGMNFQDVMISLGQIPFYNDLGSECSGVVSAVGLEVSDVKVGDHVCGMVRGAYASSLRIDSTRIAVIPPDMPFSHAASIPAVFCTAQYALFDVGRICRGESILIHAAAGGVGQAAIMLAQNAGAEVFATVGSTEKRDLIMTTYGIAEDHIFSSRDTSFAKELMSMSKQRGVDVILDSTAGEILQQTW